MANDELFATPPRSYARQRPAPRADRCVVCNLTRGCLLCKECAEQPEASIAWLMRLPVSERTTAALELLSAL